MLGLFRKRVDAETMAGFLHMLVGEVSADDEKHFASLPADVGITRDRFMAELSYLRCFAVDLACQRALTQKERQKALSAYYEAMGRDPGFVDGRRTLRQEVETRRDRYYRSLKVPHPQGPMWNVGVVFEEFCGSAGGDPLLIMLAATHFGVFLKNAEAMIRKFRVV